MSETIIESDGLRVAVRVDEARDPWPLAAAAFAAARGLADTRTSLSIGACACETKSLPKNGPEEGFSDNLHTHTRPDVGSVCVSASASGRIRELVAGMLADGRSQERRVLAKAVRDAGMRSEGLDGALERDPGHRFERDHNVAGRPIWRDITVPRPPVPGPVPDSEKPEWMRNPAAVTAATGNGATP